MSISDGVRREMLRELLAFNALPMARPSDVTAKDIMRMAREEGRSVKRCQAYRWLNNMVATAGWETELVSISGRKTRVWRKPESPNGKD